MKEAIFKSILDGSAILITGSGAHHGVLTPDGKPFPSGVELSERIYSQCGILKPEKSWDLQDATDTYIEKFGEEKLIQEIKDQLSIGQVRDYHKKLYSQPWQRVYTTNYDDVPRISTRGSRVLRPITLGEPYKSDYIDDNLCIYINGYIGHLTTETLVSEFKLTGKSYLSTTALNQSAWGELFQQDLDSSDTIVIVELSLDYDLDIKRLIFEKKVKDKIVFIEDTKITPDKRRKLERLGAVETIGIEKFIFDLCAYEKDYKPSDIFLSPIFKSFEKYMPPQNYSHISNITIYDFLVWGKQDPGLWKRISGKYTNIVYRTALGDAVSALNSSCKVIYVHANLGNGKTIFVESLKDQLRNSLKNIFTLTNNLEGITAREIKQIVEEPGAKIIIIENYYNFLSVIQQFAHLNSTNIQFILTARTVLYDTRIPEVNDMLGIKEGESTIIDLNRLCNKEIDSLCQIFDENGLWGPYSKENHSGKLKLLKKKTVGNYELQSILLSVIISNEMKKRFKETIENIKRESSQYYDILVLALLVKIMSLNINASDIGRILDVQIAFDASFTHNSNVREILDFSSGTTQFKIKSSVTAKMILNELNCNETIVKVLIKTAEYADRYRKIEKYENILKNIISYSHVKTFLSQNKEAAQFLVHYYNKLKGLEYYKKNSFYWLQYSIACLNIERFDLAQRFLDNAYSWFRDSDVVVPFQMDTHQAKLILIQIQKGELENVKEQFENAHLLLMKPVVSIKDNPVKQIINFELYLQQNIKDSVVTAAGMDFYTRCCSEAYNKIQQYLKNVRLETDRNRMEKLARKLLLTQVSK